jgi:uncharacterized protein YegL
MTNPDYTHIAVIADRSGSMFGISKDMNDGLRSFLEEQNLFPGKLLVDITTFDGQVEQVLTDGSVEDVAHPIINPRGSTALLDAIGVTVTSLGERLAKLDEDERPGKVIVMIVTDGQENSSQEYTNTKIKELVTQQQDQYQWNFLFLGANIDSFAVAGAWGISKGSTINYTASTTGTQSVLRSASAYVGATRTGLDVSFTDEDRDGAI